ncbi:MAG: hypothetical protein HFH83_01380 [Lachnospiraceae bacterium]|nr:hypothetical protein [Lachnospiraceae bacterium]
MADILKCPCFLKRFRPDPALLKYNVGGAVRCQPCELRPYRLYGKSIQHTVLIFDLHTGQVSLQKQVRLHSGKLAQTILYIVPVYPEPFMEPAQDLRLVLPLQRPDRTHGFPESLIAATGIGKVKIVGKRGFRVIHIHNADALGTGL